MSIVDRIDGTAFAGGANQPFVMDDPERVYVVEHGCLDVFAVELRDREVVGRRLFVTRIPSGAMGCGVAAMSAGDTVLALLGVPSLGAVIAEGDRSGIASWEDFDLDAMVRIEEWVFALSEFLATRPPPQDAVLLEADPDVPYPAGTSVSVHHLDVAWVSANRPVRLIGRDDLVISEETSLTPLSERIWLDLDADTEITTIHTPAALASGDLWPALDRFGQVVLRFVALLSAQKRAAVEERYRSAVHARSATNARIFRDLGNVLQSGDEPGAAGEIARTPLQAAVSMVARASGFALKLPREVNETSAEETIATLTRQSGIRIRRVSLASDWWRRDGPSFVGTRGDGRTLAVLSDGRGSWRAVDPEDGTSVAVKNGTGINRDGFVFYTPLPEVVSSGLAAVRHALRGRWPDFRLLLGMALLGGLIAMLTPVLTGVLLAEIVPRVDVPTWFAALGALCLAAFGTAMFEIVRAVALLRIEGRVDETLQSAVWNRLLSLPVGFFRDFTAGDLADRANGISAIRQLLTGATTSAVIGGVFSIFSYGLLFWYSWRLALCAGGVLMILVIATWVFARFQMVHHRAAFRIQGTIDGLVFQMITGLAKLRMANAEANALARWAERFAEQRSATLSARKWAAVQHAFNSMFTPLASIALFAFIWYTLIEAQGQPSFSLGDFLSFTAAFGQFAAGMIGLTAACTVAITAIPLFERVQPILEARPETTGGSIDPRDITGHIEFANVAFRYLPEVPNAVDGVSFTIRPGDYVAFVGASGAGKSTIYRLILGFEQPSSGAIFLDGHDLSSLDLPAVRARMGVVLQNGQLVAASIFKNIAGSTPLTMDEAWEAVRAVGLEDDIRAMPMGLHTILPEGAGDLSGGQRQRVLIARAIARKPRILLFDEATSALDNRTQAIVQATLKGLNVTRVVIAHRLSTIQDVDRIYVLEGGRIVETGTYDDLVRADGAFADLARRQVI